MLAAAGETADEVVAEAAPFLPPLVGARFARCRERGSGAGRRRFGSR